MLVKQQFQISSHVSDATEFIAGVELEIEDILGFKTHNGYDSWNVTEDGSLRNNGRELISPPLPLDNLVKGFKAIHKDLVHSKDPKPFSERTSIHVHVNMLNCTLEQSKSVLLWYSLFEPVFFSLCEYKRANNIHCVRLDQTNMSEYYNRSLPYIVSKWHKYAALNLKPLKEIGTMEFRHMEGHNDAAKFESWLKTIKNLWEWGRASPMTPSYLNEKDILAAFEFIFKDSAAKSLKPHVMELVSNNLLDIKLSFIPEI